jgi:hypothetical protein
VNQRLNLVLLTKPYNQMMQQYQNVLAKRIKQLEDQKSAESEEYLSVSENESDSDDDISVSDSDSNESSAD